MLVLPNINTQTTERQSHHDCLVVLGRNQLSSKVAPHLMYANATASHHAPHLCRFLVLAHLKESLLPKLIHTITPDCAVLFQYLATAQMVCKPHGPVCTPTATGDTERYSHL